MRFLAIAMPFILILAASLSKAQTGDWLTYGPEWTFTDEHLLEAQQELDSLSIRRQKLEYAERLNLHFFNYCQKSKKCTFESPQELYGIIKFKDGFEVYLTFDQGVVEVKAMPQSLAQWRSREKDIQAVLFEQMKILKLNPHEREGAGHLNIGLEYFRSRALLLRNFIVDFYNHPGVGTVLNSLTANAADSPYLDQMETTKAQLVEKDLRNGLAQLEKKVQFSFRHVLQHLGVPLVYKFLALGVREIGVSFDHMNYGYFGDASSVNATKNSRLEVRTLRPQASMADFIKVVEIYEARIQYLKEKKSTLKLKSAAAVTDGWAALGEFADYLEESGLVFNKFRSLLPPAWRKLSEKDFLRKSDGLGKSCRSAL